MLKKLILILVTILLLSPLTGCVSTSEYQELQNENLELTEQLTDLNEIYPPRRFTDVVELETWLQKTPNSPESVDAILWFQHALEIQKLAAGDGFIISAYLEGPDEEGYYSVYCEAILQDHSLYIWDPDTDDIYYWGDVRDF